MAQLRLIATTDLHGEVRDFDYVRGRNDPMRGLSRAAGIVARLREGVDASALLDNGDTLFGRPFADLPCGGGPDVMSALNAAGFDAMTLGNHEFDREVPPLVQTLAGARMPVVSASIVNGDGVPPDWLRPHAMIERSLPEGMLRIGVTGLLPPSSVHMPGPLRRAGLQLRDPVAALREACAALRAEGADIVVVLCHAGVGRSGCDDALLVRLARQGIVDAMILGHLHDVFPREGGAQGKDIDAEAGTIGGVPAVMPGFWGQQVGCVDLSLNHSEEGWKVAGARVFVMPVGGESRAGNAHGVLEASRSAHAAVLRLSRETVAETARPLHTFFSSLGTCHAVSLAAHAKCVAVSTALRELGEEDVPVVGLAAPVLSGGFGGAWDYVDIPSGPVTRRDLQRLAPHTDPVVGIRATVRDLQLWLERSVSAFRQIVPGEFGAALLDPAFPPSHFDLAGGARFRVDLSRPPMFSAAGGAPIGEPGRVRDLTVAGEVLPPEAPVVIATTQHRRRGGGAFPLPKGDWIETGQTVDEAILAYLGVHGGPPHDATLFSFVPLPFSRVLHVTCPKAVVRREDLGIAGVMWLDLDAEGFQKLLIPLDGAG